MKQLIPFGPEHSKTHSSEIYNSTHSNTLGPTPSSYDVYEDYCEMVRPACVCLVSHVTRPDCLTRFTYAFRGDEFNRGSRGET